MNAEQWVRSFASAAGAPAPDEQEMARVLELAAIAAHSSERRAAPIACWIAGRGGLELDRALELAEGVAPAAPGEPEAG